MRKAVLLLAFPILKESTASGNRHTLLKHLFYASECSHIFTPFFLQFVNTQQTKKLISGSYIQSLRLKVGFGTDQLAVTVSTFGPLCPSFPWPVSPQGKGCASEGTGQPHCAVDGEIDLN